MAHARRFAHGPIPTLRQTRKVSPWLWLHCPKCRHYRAVTLVRYMIVWGIDASTDRLRERSVCSCCRHRGALTYMPAFVDTVIGFAPFPPEEQREWRPTLNL